MAGIKQFNAAPHIALPNVYKNPYTRSQSIGHQFVNHMKPDPNSSDLHEKYEVDREQNIVGQSEMQDL